MACQFFNTNTLAVSAIRKFEVVQVNLAWSHLPRICEYTSQDARDWLECQKIFLSLPLVFKPECLLISFYTPNELLNNVYSPPFVIYLDFEQQARVREKVYNIILDDVKDSR